MATVSDIELANLARAAGFKGAEIAAMVAIAIAESKGNSDAFNPNDTGGTKSYGLWQINSVHSDLLATGNWRDPATNARMAYAVYQKQGYKAWGVFNSGKYLLYLPRGTAAAAGTNAQEDAGEVIENLSPIDEVRQALSDIKRGFDFITDPHNWLRLAMVIGGAGLIGIVVWPMVRDSGAVEGAVKTGKTVADVIV